MPDALVVNASPLIFLGNAGQLDLLRVAGASHVIVPQTVFDEVTATMHNDAAVRSVTEARWLERAAPVEIPVSVIEWDLGPGESSVIALALAISGARPVVDDLAGRKCALALGLNVSGTLGIVVAAHRRGHIKDPRQVMMNLRLSGMWLSDAVIESALRLARIPPSS
jgi:predicted nucleic acid-binding protein